MTRLPFATATLALLGCAEMTPPPEEPGLLVVVVPERASPASEAPAEEVAPAIEAPPPRPRLSRTITLGQGNEDVTYTAGRPVGAPSGQPAAGGNVTVNNNVVVQQPTVPVYGGYGGYGYGYRGVVGRGAFGGRTDAFRAGSGSWGASGFEGAARTAAPGQTPAVGGNWPAAPSYGPRPMR